MHAGHSALGQRQRLAAGLTCSALSHPNSSLHTVVGHFVGGYVTLTSVTVQVRMDAMQCRERTRAKSERR